MPQEEPFVLYDASYRDTLPLPLAQVYAGADPNSYQSVEERYWNAFFVFEVMMRLIAAQGVAEFRREMLASGQSSEHQEILKGIHHELREPNIGGTQRLVNVLAGIFAGREGHPLSRLRSQLDAPRKRAEFPALVRLSNRLANGPDGQPRDEQSTMVATLLQRLPTFRNPVAHTGKRKDDFHKVMAELFAAAATEMFHHGALDLIGPPGSELFCVMSREEWVVDSGHVRVGLKKLRGQKSVGQLPEILSREQAQELQLDTVAVRWAGRDSYLSLSPLLKYGGHQLHGGHLIRTGPADDRVLFIYKEGENNKGEPRPIDYFDYLTGKLEQKPGVSKQLDTGVSKQLDAYLSLQHRPRSRKYEPPPTGGVEPDDEFEHIVRIRRGAVGEVDLVRQRPFGRLVVRKTIQDEFLSDEVARTRFQRDMAILSQVRHSGVVQVLSGGLVRGRRMFYAMDYVPGTDLDAVWPQLLTPPQGPASGLEQSLLTEAARKAADERWQKFRREAKYPGALQAVRPEERRSGPEADGSKTPGGYVEHVVTLIRHAADALAAIHARGLVHGDLKPANLLLSPDGGRLVLLDFGPAKGTADLPPLDGLRYASPEQLATPPADGGSHAGPATDVRALGIVLWELLVRRRLFEDAADAATLRHRLLTEEVPSIRALDRGLHPDLDLIVAQATVRGLDARTGSAGEFADNLDRYLKGQPPAFRTPAFPERFRRWVVRYRLALAAAVMIAFACGAAAVIYNRQARRAETAEKRAEQQQRRAEEGLALAQNTVNHLTQIGRSLPFDQPGLQRTRQELLTASLEYYQRRVGQEGADPRMREDLAVTHYRLGGILESLGNKQEAVDHYLESGRLATQISAGQPWEWWRSRSAFGLTVIFDPYMAASRLQQQLGLDEAEDTSIKAIELYYEFLRKVPPEEIKKVASQSEWSDFQALFTVVEKWREAGGKHESTDPAIAEDVNDKLIGFTNAKIARLEQASKEQPFLLNQVERAKTYEILVDAQDRADRPEEARRALHRAIEILNELGPDNLDPTVNAEKARCTFRLGTLEAGPEAEAHALADFKDARELYASLAKKYYDVADYQAGQADCEREIGSLHTRAKRWDEALASCEDAVDDYRGLASEHHKHREFDRELAYALETLNGVQASITQERKEARDSRATMGKEADAWEDMAVEALDTAREALDLRQGLLDAKPNDKWRQDAFASALLMLGSSHRNMGNETDALPFLRQARELAAKLVAGQGDNLWFQNRLANCEYPLGLALLVRGEKSDALAHLERAVALYDRVSAARSLDPAEKVNFGGCCQSAADLHQQIGETDRASSLYQRAILLFKDAKATDPANTSAQKQLDFANQAFSDLLVKKGDDERAAGHIAAAQQFYDAAISSRSALRKEHPNDLETRGRLAEVYSLLSVLYQETDVPRALGYAETRLSLLTLEPDVAPSDKWRLEHANAYGGLACLHLLSNDPKKAISCCQHGLKILPDSLYNLGQLACAYAATAQLEKAKAIYLSHRGENVPEAQNIAFGDYILAQLEGICRHGADHPDITKLENWLHSQPPTSQ